MSEPLQPPAAPKLPTVAATPQLAAPPKLPAAPKLPKPAKPTPPPVPPRQQDSLGFYDNARDALRTWQPKGTPQQLLAHLGKHGGAHAQSEIHGLRDWLKDRPQVTRDEVHDFLKDKHPELVEHRQGRSGGKISEDDRHLGDDERVHYSGWQLKGPAEDYSEFHIAAPGVRNVRELSAGWLDGHDGYSHVKNPVVRARHNTRTAADGKKMLFLEELQGPQDAEQKKMPPWLRDRIYDIGLKRMLRHAVESGHDRIGWTTGAQQADRYGLSYQSISGDGLKVGGEGLKSLYDNIIPAKAAKLLKKAGAKVGTTKIKVVTGNSPVAVQIRSGPSGDAYGVFGSNGDLIESFPSQVEANDYLKKNLASLSGASAYETVHSIDITPAVRDLVREGFAMYRKADADVLRYAAERAPKGGVTIHTDDGTVYAWMGEWVPI